MQGTIVPLGYPVLGIERGSPPSEIEPGKCLEARNVRAFSPETDRRGGGKRPGSVKALSDIAGTAAGRRINHLDILTQASGIPGGSDGTATAVDTTVGSLTFGSVTAASPADLGGDLESGSIEDRVEGRHIGVGDPPDAVDVGGGNIEIQFGFGSAGSTSTLDSGPTAMAYISPRFRCLNNITATFRAIGTVSNPGVGVDKEATSMGPFVRGDDQLQKIYAARLVRVATNDSVRLEIVTIAPGSPVAVAVQSSTVEIAMDGTATETTDLSISITDDGATIVATALWPSMATATADATWNDGTLQTSVSTDDQNDKLRVGVFSTGGGSGAEQNRHLRRLEYTKFVPAPRAVDSTINPSSDGGASFFLPAGFTPMTKDGTASPTLETGSDPYTAGSSHGDWPEVNNASDVVEFDPPTSSDERVSAAIDTVGPETGDRLAVQIQLLLAHQAQEDLAGALFRCSQDFGTFVSIHPEGVGTAASGDNQRQIRGFIIRASESSSIQTVELEDLGPSDLDYLPTVHADGGEYVFTDDGTTVRLYINNLVVFERDLTGLPGWTQAIEDAVASQTLSGISTSVDTSASSAQVGQCRLVSGEEVSTVDVSEVEPKVLVCTQNKVQIGDLLNDTLDDASGDGFLNPLVQSFSFNGKFYAVDGTRAKKIDPVALTVVDWVDTVAANPIAGHRLCALYKSSALIARSDSDPTSIFMSRRFNVEDFGYLQDPQADTPIDFTAAGGPGRPDKAITALAPHQDDYCIVGSSDEIGVIAGDPRRGGTFENLTRRTGIIGPRSFTWDGKGNFWFLGTGGLHVWAPGAQRPEPFGNKSLYKTLERVDASKTFIQLAYDKFSGLLHIHLTPTDGTTVGVHIVFRIETGEFVEDSFPLTYGPWSVAESTGATDQLRRFIFGCDEGYVRWLKDGVYSDDGSSIESYVEYAPIPDGATRHETIVSELQFVMSEGTTALDWRLFSGDSHNQVARQVVGSESASGIGLAAGLNEPVGVRSRGEAHKLRLEQDSATATWAVEEVYAELQGAGRVRRSQ